MIIQYSERYAEYFYIPIAEFERYLIKERQLEGIALAKKRGAYKGRKRSLGDEQIQVLKNRVQAGEKKSQIACDFGISRETLYQYLKQVTPVLE